MKRPLLMILVMLSALPLYASTLYIDTQRRTHHIVVSPDDTFIVHGHGRYYDAYGTHIVYRVHPFYTVHATPRYRPEVFLNNSGSGTHGPGNY